ncbi:MAG: TIGR01459 family HAD-type hydrolase, partial [Paracoccaceae bacterium]
MTRIIASLAEISADYDALFCDLWGCVHNGKTPFPAAVAALQRFRAQGGKVILLTNAPRPKPSVVAQIDAMGLPRDAWDDVVTSGDAAQYALVTGAVGRRVHFIGTERELSFFHDFAADLARVATEQSPVEIVPIDKAEGIVCTGLRDDHVETPEDYRGELLMAKTLGLPMLCANPDIVVHYGDKLLYCAGALAREYEGMGGTAFYFGKPHPPIYDMARRRLAALGGGERILAIGDGPATDVLGGVTEGLDTIFVTGGIEAHNFG